MFAACMRSPLFIGSIGILLLFSFYAIGGIGCANIVPPQGGPRDSLPPVLLKSSPGDSTRNYGSTRLNFSFDEFIELDNWQQNLVISPLPVKPPEVDYRLNTMTIRLKDSLQPNTTYQLNFGNAIKDYNEGNVLKNFTYIFSTGPYIDSLELSGNVILAENGKTDSTLIVMLHANGNDSAVIHEQPRYITRLDGTGRFHFKNLPPVKFYLYAMKDDGGSRKYLNDKNLFAFADSAVFIQSKNNPVTLYAFQPKQTTRAVTPVSPGIGGRKLGGGATDRRLRYLTNLVNGQQDLLNDFMMTFEIPLKDFDPNKIRLATDSIFTPVTNYTLVKDSSNKKLKLTNTWKENTLYHLIIDRDFASDTSGKKLLKTDTLNFLSKKTSDYGGLKLRFRNLDLSKNPVLLIVSNEIIYKSYPLQSAELYQALFLPGDYELRILYDLNRNGIWDTGEFFGKHRQPEQVIPVQRRVLVKPGLENDVEIQL